RAGWTGFCRGRRSPSRNWFRTDRLGGLGGLGGRRGGSARDEVEVGADAGVVAQGGDGAGVPVRADDHVAAMGQGPKSVNRPYIARSPNKLVSSIVVTCWT